MPCSASQVRPERIQIFSMPAWSMRLQAASSMISFARTITTVPSPFLAFAVTS